MEDIKARGRISCIVILTLGLLTACGQGGTAFEGGDDQKLGTAVPSAIGASNLPDDSLLRVFLDVNGERRSMTINGGTVETTVTNLPEGANTVAIVFEYQSPNFGDVILATATQTLNLQLGQNSLAFNEQDYQFPDDDGDGATNLAEIKNNTDPGDPNDLLRQWGVAVPISNAVDSFSFGLPNLVVDPSGNGLVVWKHFDWSDGMANRFEPDTGWGTAELIASGAPGIAMDANGNGIAHWTEGSSIRAKRFDPASGWGTVDRLDPESSDQLIPQRSGLAMNDGGVAVAVWDQRDELNGVINSIWANRFDPATGWGDAEAIDNSSLESAISAEVAVDANGNALAIWAQGGNLWANRYIANTGWGAATQIATLVIGFSNKFDISMHSNGNGMAVWVEFANARYTVKARHFDATTGMWGDAILIESPSVGASPEATTPNVAFDAAGNALVVWQQTVEGATTSNVYANRFEPALGWGSATLIEDMDGRVFVGEHGLAVSANGEALAVWSQYDGTRNNVWANDFDPAADAWGTPVLIENNSDDATGATIALDNSGRGLAAWAQSQPGDMKAIWSNRLE